MNPLSTIKTVFDFFAGEAASDGTDLTKDIIKDILNKRKLIELLEQYDQRFMAEHLTEISDKKINMKPIFDQRKDLIRFAEESMTNAFVDVNISRKDQFLKRACEKTGENSDCVRLYLSGFYDMVFMKETKGVSEEDKAFFNSLSDQICTEFKRIDREVKGLGKRVDDLENGQPGPVDFSSFYDAVLKDFTEENENPSADLVGNLSAEKAYIDAYIKVKNEERPVLSYLDKWFSEKKYGALLIHGEPGHGKSTLCKKAVFEYVNSRFLNNRAKNVLIVSLNTGLNPRIISDKGVSYEDMLVWGPVGEHRFSFDDCRGTLLFMDGFDEFIDDAAKTGAREQNIVSFMDRVGRIARSYDIHIIVLSRTIAVERYLEESAIHDKCFSLAPITREQQVKWLDEHEPDVEYKEKFKRLQEDENMRVLLGIPLLFRMIVHTRFDRTSSNVVKLYDDLFDHLMEKREIWDSALESVRKGLNKLAYEVYCNDTIMADIKEDEWNENWVFAFYVKTFGKQKVGFFHGSFYQYFLAKYLYNGLLGVTEENVRDFLGPLAERELDETVRKNISLLADSDELKKAHDNMGLAVNALCRTEAYLCFTPKNSFGNAEKTKIGRSTNIMINTMHLAASLRYVIPMPFKEGLDTLIRTFGGQNLEIFSDGKNRADLSGVDLRGAYLNGAHLRGANLSGAYLRGADLRGAYLSGASLIKADLRGACLRGAYLNGADLNGADLKGADLKGADTSGVDLRGASLMGVDLRGASLRGADLREVDLSRVDLSKALLIEADLRGGSLIGANLSEANMIEANLSGTHLNGVNLCGADLSEAFLFRANLSGADLRGANLRRAGLNEAYLNGADLREADLSGAYLTVKCISYASIDSRYKDMIDPGIEGYETIRWG